MAKDKMMQQQAFERKKEKWDRRRETGRGADRKGEKDDKRRHKEEKHLRGKEQKEVTRHRAADVKVSLARGAAAALIIGLYLAGMAAVMRQRDATGDEPAAGPAGWQNFVPHALTVGAAVALAVVCFAGADWRSQLAKEEEQREAASQIKGQLQRKLTEKEREEKMKKWRAQQLKESKERAKRRAEEETAALKQAKELAQVLRRRREEREAEEARMRAAAASKMAAGDGEQDVHGWTLTQRQQLLEAVKQYPENWSHARKRRWEMIAGEVSGQDARSCEAAFARIEEEARMAAAAAKANRQKAPNSSGADPAAGLDNDLDWLGGDEGQTTMGEDLGDSEEDEDEEEEEDEHRRRMPVELEPDHKGTEIRLEGIKEMQGCASVQVEVLHLQLSCADCRTSARVYLSGADEVAADAKSWCEGCSGLVSVRLRPTLVHRASSRLCYVDCVRCSVTDVLPSVLMSVCEACDAPNVHKQEFVRNRMVSGTCRACHEKYAFRAESVRIEAVTPCDPGHGGRGSKSQAGSSDGGDDPMDEIAEELRWLRKKAKTDPHQQLIKLGSPLPQMGACRHFKKSYKWYRFACCGRAFPCPECHVESGCPAAALGAHASRMICGKCSMEQAYSPARPCEKCGFIMQARGSSHWDGGDGTRSLTAMSTKDAKKFKGGLRQTNSKFKTSSGKSDRVGAKAKAKRDHDKKFGRDG